MWVWGCVCVCVYVCVGVCVSVCGNRINIVYDSEFHASLQSSEIQYYFYVPKNKQIKTVIYIYHVKIQNIIFLILIHTIF